MVTELGSSQRQVSLIQKMEKLADESFQGALKTVSAYKIAQRQVPTIEKVYRDVTDSECQTDQLHLFQMVHPQDYMSGRIV